MGDQKDMRSPRELIEYIRREEYGVDVDASEQEQRRAKNLRGKLDRALALLSQDLYSKKTHFILELIQNADDNSYSPGVVPSLRLQLSPERMVLVNNELGFAPKHVIALCDIGKSSKAKKKGYIGEKGIGFKSVFTVSDAPEIHSNGYHFRFDRTGDDNLLGYVVPEWHHPPKALISDATTIILPAKKGESFSGTIVAELRAELLLFLSRLKRLELVYDATTTIFEREDEKGFTRLLTITTPANRGSKTEEAVFLRCSSVISMDKASDEKRPDSETSEIVLAFPVSANGTANPQTDSQVFAFLPINAFGFKFSIQADFILSSSREAVHTERNWNKRLRDSIAKTFVAALDQIRERDLLAYGYLKYIPNDSDIVDPFFKPVTTQIISLLKETKCLPSASGEWRVPGSLKYGSPSFQRLFPPAVAQALFGFDYVDSRAATDSTILARLGAKPIHFRDFVNVFENHGDWFKKQPLEWKGDFYACLADMDRDGLIKAGLLSTPCVPTSAGTLVSPNQVHTFYPFTRGAKYGFEDELTIIDIDLLERAAKQSTNVESFFNALNVRKDDPYNLIMSHILPRHESEAWKTAENKAIVGHVRYIKEKLPQYIAGAANAGKSESDAIEAISSGIWIGTKQNAEDNWIFSLADTLYISKEYAPRFCIESLLKGDLPKTLLISDEYLSGKAKDAASEAQSWRDFFARIGVREAPKIEKLSDGNIRPSAEFQALLAAPQSSVRKATLECIDRNWDDYAHKLRFFFRSGRNLSVKETTLGQALCSMNAPTKRRTPTPISETFYPNKDLKELFGNAPVYVDAVLVREELLEACHITFRINASACIKRLKQLKTRGDETTPQVSTIYRHLERLWDTDFEYIRDAFAQEGLIRVKGPHATWATPDEVVWRSGGAFLDSLYPPLLGQYHDFSAFFKRLGVARELPLNKLVDALPRLVNIESIKDRAREALAIYKRASHDLTSYSRAAEGVAPEWLDSFLNEGVFLNHRGELVPNDTNLFVNDAPDLGALFTDDPDISLFAVPFEDLPRVRSLIEAVEMQSLAASVEAEIVEATDSQQRSDLTKKITSIVTLIARGLYAKSHVKFSSALSQGLFQRLRDLEIVEVSDLQLEVTINGVSRRAARDIASTEGRIVIRRGARSVIDQLAMKLCEFLKAPDELVDIISRLLLADSEETAEDFLRVRGISALPLDIEKALLTGEQEEMTELDFDDELDDNIQASNTSMGTDAEGDQGGADDLPERQLDGQTPTQASARPATNTPTLNSGSVKKQAQPRASGTPAKHKAEGADGSTNRSTTARGTDQGNTSDEDDSSTLKDQTAPATGNGSNLDAFQQREAGRREPYQLQVSDLQRGRGGRRAADRNNRRLRTKSGRLMSYAASPEEAERASKEEDPARISARDVTAQAAVEYVLATQGNYWKSLISMPHNNPGFDIKAVSLEGHDEFIEVKGQSAAWTEDGVALTPTELVAAQRHGERYWLCIVEFATDEKRRRLYLVKNPFGLTQQFRFDSGWKSAAYIQSTALLNPGAGLNIQLPELGKGKILSVRKKGEFYNLHVVLIDGRQVNRIFNPATMKLSVD